MEEELTQYIQKQFPDSTVKLVGSGWSSYAFEVGDKIIRVPRVDTKQYEKEIAILNFLNNKLPVKIPHPKLVKGDISYAIHTKINGLSWNMSSYNKLSKEEKNLFAKDIAHFFATLHAIPLNEILKSIPKELITPAPMDSVDKFYGYLQNDFSKHDIDTVYNWCKNILNPSENPVLLHNDFWEANCLVDEHHRLIGVFDWANAHLGKPECDFKPLYCPEYFPLLDKILEFYYQETGRKISKDKIKTEKLPDCLGNVQYFGQNPDLKTTMANQWKETLTSVRDTLNMIQAENK